MAQMFKQEMVDPLDLDRYLNLDQVGFSPSSSRGKQQIRTPEFQAPRPNQAFLQKNYSGPSHQYDLHQQQTGLPVGGFATSLAGAAQQQQQQQQRPAGFQVGEDLFDFNNMDMDFDSPIEGLFPSTSSDGDFVDPNAIGGQEEAMSPAARQEIIRLWPGMHTQQAAMAKQQQQQEILRQQQMKAQQLHGHAAGGAAAHRRTNSRVTGPVGGRPTDPVVEERISRLLNQMRHSSVGSSNEDATTPQASSSQAQKAKKDEEEMDEDERLLASEEGKKLSSKERRQLRNKVSARAFRSRRKEYIGQLEGEINNKSNECEQLRAKCEALEAENTRLTDLSKMLLASPAFSNFLNDLSANGVPSLPEAILQPQQALPVPQPQQQIRKDINPMHQRQMQSETQGNVPANMAVIPETDDFSAVDPSSSWNSGLDFGFNTQVFAVLELPQGPAVDHFDADILSGKSSSFVPTKSTMPVVEFTPKLEVPAPAQAAIKLTAEEAADPAFALFADAPSPSPSSDAASSTMQIFGAIPLEKAFARIELVVDHEEPSNASVSTAAVARFESLCASLDSLSSNI